MSKSMKKELVPELRFPEFRDSGEWQLSPLRKLATSCTEKNRDGNIVRVLTNSAEHGIVDQRDYFDKDIAVQGNLEGYFIVKKGDFVYNPRISSMAPVGPISKNNIATGVMSPLYTVFRFNFENDDYYVHFFKTSGWHHYMRQVSSTGARHDRMAISKSDFIAMPIPTPTAQEEQQKIADCLSSLDELITAHTQKHQALQFYKKGLMQNLFPAEGQTIPKLRFPEFLKAGNWQKMQLVKVCNMQAGKFVRAAEIKDKDGQFVFPCFGGNGLRGYTKSFTHDGEYSLIGRQGALCGNITLAKGKFHATEHAVVVTPEEQINTYWLHYELIRLDLNKYATGQAQPGLSVDNLERVMTCIPKNEDEQLKIANCLSSVDDLIAAQAQKIEVLKAHKKGLLQGMFPAVGETR